MDPAEAILSSSGRIEHAIGIAKSGHSQAALREALQRIDGARRARRSDQGAAVDLWQGLVAGRWSLVEHFEKDGRHYFLAHRNDPLLTRARALTARQRQIWSYAAMGRSNKLIAYSLGLSPSTVAAHLSEAQRKLGRRATLAAFQALMAPHPEPLQ
jgi:DNA-binding NarL/FixJ family response regulator